MKTRSYNVLRVITQTLAAISICSSFVGLGAIYFSKIGKVEVNLPSGPTFFFCDLGVYMCAINILFSLVSACCITSKYKISMTICKKLLLFEVGFFACAIAYFYVWYSSSMIDCYNIGMLKNAIGIASLLMVIGVKQVNNSMVLGFKVHIEQYVHIFCAAKLVSVLCIIGMVKALRACTKTELETKEARHPRMAEAVSLGNKARAIETKIISVGGIAA